MIGIFSEWSVRSILLRICASLLLGGIIGLDRGLKHKGAGTKTNTIVCLTATLVMLTEQYIQFTFPGLANMTRMSAQVISGVGFLGVGTIMVSNHQVKGLTTAATLWACACVGLSVGIGFIGGGLLITVAMLVALHLLPMVETFATKKSRYQSLYIEVEKTHNIHLIISKLKKMNIKIESFEIIKPKLKGQPCGVYMDIITPKPMETEEIYNIFSQDELASSVDFL